MIDIKDISGRIKLSIEIKKGSIRRFELMKEDFIQLKFSLATPIYFTIGDNVEVEGVPFYITELMYPSYNEVTGGYDYELKFDSHYYRWKNHILFYDRQGNNEATWSLTRSPEAHLGIVVSNIRSLGFKFKDLDYQAVVEGSVDSTAKWVKYESTNIIDALTKLAETWECEWWVEGDKIYLGRCEHGNPINLEIGKELVSMNRSQSKETYANRIYAFGSTRNIPSTYRSHTGEGNVIEGIVTKRLMLPAGIDHVDVIEGLQDSEVVDRVVIFDTIYPRTNCVITSVEVKDVTETPEEGKTETYKIYRLRDANFHFSSKYILPGQELRLEFQSGPLSGFDFAVTFNPDNADENVDASQVFEIIRNQDYGQWLPAEPLIPTVGSQFILYGFDTKFVSDQLLGNAERELLEKTQAYVQKLNIDPSTYNCVVNPYIASGYDANTGAFNPALAIEMEVGQKVNLVNKAIFKAGRVSRIIGFEKKLDIPYDSPMYIIGESSVYSRIGELEKKVENIQFKGNTYVNQTGGENIYVIKKDDPIAASDENVFSSLRTLKEINLTKIEIEEKYLRKDINDTGAGFYTWEAGWMTKKPIRSAIYNTGWEESTPKGFYLTETGTAWLTTVNVRGALLCNNVFGSPYFASGWTGFGTQLDFASSTLELNTLIARKSIKAYQFIVNQVRGTNGSLAVTDTLTIESVEDKGDVWRCTIDDLDGEMWMCFRAGDVIRCQSWKKLTGKYYKASVTEVGDDWFDVSKNLLEGTDIPEPGDTIYRWTNETDADRQGLLYLTSSDSGAPYMDVRYGAPGVTYGSIKVRQGRLDGINDPLFPELYGARNNFGLYTSNFYGTGELILRSTGESVSRTFEILKDRMAAGFNEIREEIYVSPDSILQNPSFLDGKMDYWEATNTIYPYTFGSTVLVANGTLFSNIASGAQIVTDELNNRSVMQVTSTLVRQRNANFTGREAGKYAVSFSYRPITSYGSLTVGVEGSDLMITVPLRDTSKWQRAEVTGDWDGTGDFVIEVVGGGVVNIVDISFADDRLTNAISKIKVEYDTQLKLKADGATLDSFRKEYDEFNRVVREDYATQSWTATKIQSEVGTIIDGKLANYSTISQTSQMINNKVVDLNLGQYATTTWTADQIKNFVTNSEMESELSQTAGEFNFVIRTIKQDVEDAKDQAKAAQKKADANGIITDAFYSLTGQGLKANRRIELGPLSLVGFRAQGGISPNEDNVCFWAGGEYNQAVNGTAKGVIRHDGSGYLAGGNISWDTAGNTTVRGRFESSSSGNRIVLEPSGNNLLDETKIKAINNYNQTVAQLGFMQSGGRTSSMLILENYDTSGKIFGRTKVFPGDITLSFNDGNPALLDMRIGRCARVNKFTIKIALPNESEADWLEMYRTSDGTVKVKLN